MRGCIAVLAVLPARARASEWPFEAGAGVLTSLRVAGDEQPFGSVDAFARFTMMLPALEIGAAYEHLSFAERSTDGGYFRGEFQLRPFVFFTPVIAQWFDPYVGVGGLIGGVRYGNWNLRRAVGYVGGGADVRVSPDFGGVHFAISIRVRWHFVNDPRSDDGVYVLLGMLLRLAAQGGPGYPNCDNDDDCRAGEFCVNHVCASSRDDADSPTALPGRSAHGADRSCHRPGRAS